MAGLGITRKVDSLAYGVNQGVTQGMLPLAAYCYGAGKRKRLRECIFLSTAITVLFSLLSTAISCVFAPQIIRLFINDAETTTAGTQFLRTLSLAIPLYSITFVVIAVFQAMNRTKEPIILSILHKGSIDIFLMCREILPIMQKQKFGRIVNTASVAARDGGHHGGAHYVTSKCATFGLTRHLAKAFAADGITINNIAPGQMLTDGGGLLIEDRKPNPLCTMGRRGEAYEFAGAACYLCSGVASYITGTSIDVNGGLVFPG